jgi:hypothetical protein
MHICKTAACLGILLALSNVSRGIINPRFTPVHLTEEADLIVVGPLQATEDPLEWKLSATVSVKGKPSAEYTLSLAACDKDHVQEIQQTLSKNDRQHVIFFADTESEEKRGYLHVLGWWLDARPGGKDRWQVSGHAPQMAGVFAGGTDMLIRMTRHLAESPTADVPITAGVRWLDHTRLGHVPGEIAGMAAVDVGEADGTCLFVASSEGDRLFRPKPEEAFEDVTTAAGLDSRSRRFTWLDVDGDGLADLITWDGKTISMRPARRDGTFAPADAAWSIPLDTPCLGLASCSYGRRPGVVASTYSGPLLLVADPARRWKQVELPGARDLKTTSAGHPIAADFDRDGYPDLLLPGAERGALWKGTRDGFDAPREVTVSGGPAPCLDVTGDFDGDGSLDIFLAGQEKNSLWENDGAGSFRDVLRHCGSLSYKCPPGVADVIVGDLNHDGRQDLCMAYGRGALLYHWNRGFRTFAEEGEVRLPGTRVAPGRPPLGQVALTAGDFNGDGSWDLAAVMANGDVYCYFNEQMNMPGVRLRLAGGLTGPVTASCWTTSNHPVCMGTVSVFGHLPGSYIGVRRPGRYQIRYHLPEAPEQHRQVIVLKGPKDVILDVRADMADPK